MFETGQTPTEEIGQLEAQLDDLRDAIQRSRRLIVAGRACAFGGAALLLSVMVGLSPFSQLQMIVGITAALGGLVRRASA